MLGPRYYLGGEDLITSHLYNSWLCFVEEIQNYAAIMNLPEADRAAQLEKTYGNNAVTAVTLYEDHTWVLAETLAMQHHCIMHSIECMKFWSALGEDIYPEDDDKGRDLAKIKAALEQAKKEDHKALNDLSGKASNDAHTRAGTTSEQEEKQKFLKQCALLLNLNKMKAAYQTLFVAGNDQSLDPPNNYTTANTTILHTLDVANDGDRNQIVNSLMTSQHEQLKGFLDITPDIAAALSPKIRFYKVFNHPGSGELREVQFSFPTSYNPDVGKYLLKNRSDGTAFAGEQSGIKDFTWSFEGTTPATARNDIKASLSLYFQNFSDLLKERTNQDLFGNDTSNGHKFKYIELLLLPFNDSETEADINFLSHDPKDYRIKVDVGYEIRDDEYFNKIVSDRGNDDFAGYTDKGEFINKIKYAIKLMNKSYYLNMVDHDLNFRDDGSVDIKVEYRAYLESAMKSPKLDALTTPEIAKRKEILRKEYDKIIKDKLCADPKNKTDFEQLILAYNAIELDGLKTSHQSIVRRLVEREKMHYCFIDNGAVTTFKQKGFFPSIPTITFPKQFAVPKTSQITTETIAQEDPNDSDLRIDVDVFLDKSLEKLGTLPTGPRTNQTTITYFYMGDLINVIMDCIIDPNSLKISDHLKRMKVLLGSFDYVDQFDQKFNVNISEIPIATEYFFEWMNENIIKVKKRAYPVALYIRDLCNKLIVDLMLETCINKSISKGLYFNTMSILAHGKHDVDPFSAMKKIPGTGHIDVTRAYKEKELPLVSFVPEGSLEQMYNYFLVYPVSDNTQYTGEGMFDDDGMKGVYHFGIGRDRGIVKKVKFNKTDIQGLREARFFNHGTDGLLQLGAVYKVTLEMIGNTVFYPGMEIFIDPRGLGGTSFDPTKVNSVAHSLGLGGYHLITKVNSAIGPGKFNTTVEAIFVYSGSPGSQKVNKPTLIQEPPVNPMTVASKPLTNACSRISHIRATRFDQGLDVEENLSELNIEELSKRK